jgi:glycosyltransferase involved in cell wall biosynthesis
MISFIVIGRNESHNLDRCFQSIYETIDHCCLSAYELIYIDSNSKDESIRVAEKYKNINIYQLTADFNAAIARNLGAEAATGDTLFFIDGDMSINKNFLLEVQYKYNLQKSVLTGNVILVYGEIVLRKGAGFVIIIGKEIWELYNGMKVKYRKAQDAEFLFRLNNKKAIQQKVDVTIAKHYTKNWISAGEMLKCFFRGDTLYRGVFYRDYLFSWKMWKFIIRNEYAALLLFGLLILALLNIANLLFLIIYFVVLLIKIVVKRNLSVSDFFLRILYYFSRDISIYIGFFFFHPSNKKNLQYKKIQ